VRLIKIENSINTVLLDVIKAHDVGTLPGEFACQRTQSKHHRRFIGALDVIEIKG
jgi:hypothetical protein